MLENGQQKKIKLCWVEKDPEKREIRVCNASFFLHMGKTFAQLCDVVKRVHDFTSVKCVYNNSKCKIISVEAVSQWLIISVKAVSQ